MGNNLSRILELYILTSNVGHIMGKRHNMIYIYIYTAKGPHTAGTADFWPTRPRIVDCNRLRYQGMIGKMLTWAVYSRLWGSYKKSTSEYISIAVRTMSKTYWRTTFHKSPGTNIQSYLQSNFSTKKAQIKNPVLLKPCVQWTPRTDKKRA